MTCVSLTACRLERHEKAPCADCGTPYCVHALEYRRCIECVGRRLRTARLEGRVDAFGERRESGDEHDAADERYSWGSVERLPERAAAASGVARERPGLAKTTAGAASGPRASAGRVGASGELSR